MSMAATMRSLSFVALAALALQPGCTKAYPGAQPGADAELLHAAVHELTRVIVYDIFNPPQAARAYAYSSIAAFEAVRHLDPAYRSLAGGLNELEAAPAPDADLEYHFPLASVHAFLTVGKALTFSTARVDSVREAVHGRIRRSGVPAPVVQRSIEYGERIARHILEWAANDYYAQLRGYPKFTVTTEEGRWVPTPPAYMDGIEPSWARVRPLVLDSAGQFRPPPPVPFDMTEGSPFHRQVMEVYQAVSDATDEQRATALFWDDNPYVMHVRGHAMFATKKITPGGHWMGIATIAARATEADIVESAAAYARTAIALHDGFLSCWEEKYRSNLIRPETVINQYLDEDWMPILQTPPFPEYTSGHSVISTAAALVLTDQFGDDFAYYDDATAEYGITPRSFGSFLEAAEEAAISRLYGGIHYRMAIDEGVEQGRRVGLLLAERLRLRPDPIFAGDPAAAGAPPSP
jgi:hypothetical protein